MLPSSFRFLSSRSRIYLPLASSAEERGGGDRHSGSSTRMIGRLAAGVSLDEAQSRDRRAQRHRRTDGSSGADDQRRWIPIAGGTAARVARRRSSPRAAPRAGGSAVPARDRRRQRHQPSAHSGDRAAQRAGGQTGAWCRTPAHRGRGGARNDIAHAHWWTCRRRCGAAGIRLLTALGSSRLPLGTQLSFDVRVARWRWPSH